MLVLYSSTPTTPHHIRLCSNYSPNDTHTRINIISFSLCSILDFGHGTITFPHPTKLGTRASYSHQTTPKREESKGNFFYKKKQRRRKKKKKELHNSYTPALPCPATITKTTHTKKKKQPWVKVIFPIFKAKVHTLQLADLFSILLLSINYIFFFFYFFFLKKKLPSLDILTCMSHFCCQFRDLSPSLLCCLNTHN